MTDEFKLTDVDLNENVKDYTDTPAKFRAINQMEKNR